MRRKEPTFHLHFSVDKEETKKVVAKKAKKFLAKKKDATIKRVDGKFVITKHVHGIAIDLMRMQRSWQKFLIIRTGIIGLLYFRWIIL